MVVCVNQHIKNPYITHVKGIRLICLPACQSDDSGLADLRQREASLSKIRVSSDLLNPQAGM